MWRWAGRQPKPFEGETIIAQSANFFGGIGVGFVVGVRACVGVFSL
jgi:hypothetical protein